MDDLSDKLSKILSDPDAVEQLKSVASSLLSKDGESEKTERAEEIYEDSDDGGLGDLLGNIDIGTLTKIFSKLKAGPNDRKANLLRALKPLLSDKRKGKVDEAIRLLSLTNLLPLVKDIL